MITGGHVMIFSRDADADRAFLRDILKLDHVDAGHGWLIFKLTEAEVGVHPSDENDLHKLYLMCDDLDAEIARLKRDGVACETPSQQGWGRSTTVPLPGGGRIGLYEPRHARP